MNFYPSGAIIAGHYEVVGRPLVGGMGIVYLCLDHQTQHPVALKTFKPEFLPDRAARDRFLREGTTWVNLGNHPHIVRCHGVEHADDGLEVFLVLELVAKEKGRTDASLRSWLTPGQPLPVAQALLFTLQIVRGMKHATGIIPGFVHRDLKPENVLVGADSLANVNHLRVTDFGLAIVLQEAVGDIDDAAKFGIQPSVNSSWLTRTHLTHGVVGTPLYMAPEQWRGESVSMTTDVYALGCMLYEMVTGRRAVVGRNWRDLEQSHCTGRIAVLPQELPIEICNLVHICLALSPKDRYKNWETIESELTQTYQNVLGEDVPIQTIEGETPFDRLDVGGAYIALGRAYMDISKHKTAAEYFERGVKIGQAMQRYDLKGANNNQSLVEATRRYANGLVSLGIGLLGSAALALHDVQQAQIYCEQALMFARDEGNRHSEEEALLLLAHNSILLNDVERTQECLEQALDIVEENGDWADRGKILNDIGNCYRSLHNWQRARECFEQALLMAKESKDQIEEGEILNDLGHMSRKSGNVQHARECFEKAGKCFEQALDIVEESGDQSGEKNILRNLGIAYRELGDSQRALKCFERRLVIVQQEENWLDEIETQNILGDTHLGLGRAQQALKYYEQALVTARKTARRQSETIALHSMGNSYYALGDAHEAQVCYEKALATALDIGDQFLAKANLHKLGDIHRKVGDTRQAIELYERYLAIESEENHAEQRNTLIILGVLYFDLSQQQFEQEAHIMETVASQWDLLQQFDQIGSSLKERRFAKAYQLILEKQGQILQVESQILEAQEHLLRAQQHAMRSMQLFIQIGDLQQSQTLKKSIISFAQTQESITGLEHILERNRVNTDALEKHIYPLLTAK